MLCKGKDRLIRYNYPKLAAIKEIDKLKKVYKILESF